MTDFIARNGFDTVSQRARTLRRYRAERRFRFYGLAALSVAILFLALLLWTIFGNALGAFQQTMIRLPVHFAEDIVDPQGTREVQNLGVADYGGLLKRAIRERFSEVTERPVKRKLYDIVSPAAVFELRDMVMREAETARTGEVGIIGLTRDVWLTASDDVDQFLKGRISIETPEAHRRISDQQIAWVENLVQDDAIEKRFNTRFFTGADSREPEIAGVGGAVVGSFLTLFVTLILTFPIGVAAAIHLEELAPKNRWTDLIDININNLAAVPSVVFGLLGLAVFLNFFGFPRSAPIVGGMVLALMTLPTIIIASRASLRAVPPSIREAALGMGASRHQVIGHHVLPMALPGMLTGTIIGMAQALGETAPLLMIGMVAFIADIPGGLFEPATVLPVQIFIWADSPERAFVERTSAAILVLLVFLACMNLAAIIMRKKFEIKY